MSTIIQWGEADLAFTELVGVDHTSDMYSYTFTAPSDGIYILQSIFSAYAGGGSVTIKSGTEIFRQHWESKYGGHGVEQVVAKMSAENTASLCVGGQKPSGGNSKVGYHV